jgi:hypothetical protein
MLDGVIKALTPEKMVVVVVAENDVMYVFDRATFQGPILNRATRPWGTNPDKRGQKLVKMVAAAHNRKCTTVRSSAIAEAVYFTFWFPQPGTFRVEDWQGKVAELADETVVPKAKRRVIEAALIKARNKQTAANMRQVA